MALVDVLLPTYNRLPSLIMTLSGLAGQTLSDFRLVVSDQSSTPAADDLVIQSLIRILEAHGVEVEWHYRVPSQGIAEQRDFLLKRSTAHYILYLDDDVWMEPWVLQKLFDVIYEQGCGFVGAFPYGLSYCDDYRPQQQSIEYWAGKVQPEAVDPDTPAWERFHLHRAANSFHISRTITPGEVKLYKVAWIAACILYDRQKVLQVGGYSFWNQLPRYQSGEEVLLQNLLMRRFGGCAILPSGTYFSELPSTVLNEKGTVDGHALSLLSAMVDKYTT